MLQADNSQSRVVNGNHNTNPLAASARLIPNDPITPHTIGQAAITNSSISQLLQPGILLVGQQLESKVPQMTPLIDDPYQNTTSKSLKRKSESSTQHSTSTKETQPKKLKSKETKIGNLSSFPLPSMKRARRLTMSFKSFQDVWDELETIPLQKEIFIRRLYKYDYKLLD
jgi:ERCC4-type nuclease